MRKENTTMAGKRIFGGPESDDQDNNQDESPKRPRMSLRSVVGEVVMVNSLQNLFTSLEPLLRRVVSEEVEDVLERRARTLFTRSPSLRIQALEPSSLKLVFPKALHLPIFTGSKIHDVDGGALQILIVDKNCGQNVPISLAQPVKVEIVVLDGDFPQREDSWTSAQFDKSIVKERYGKRPLLHGDLSFTVRDGSATVGDIEFTDNSSWIRCRKFRIAAKVVSSHGFSVGEAMTEAFVVKDHRGELYKKHHPPQLADEVWRLEKIGKDGAFHKKLSDEGIKTVQEFLKLSVIDPQRLRKILGPGMSEKMWDVTLKHALTCEMGNKRYIYRGSESCTITLTPICQVVKAVINGHVYPIRDINKSYIEGWIRDAYRKWNSLEVVDAIMNEPPLLTQGEIVEMAMVDNHHQHNNVVDDKMLNMMSVNGYSLHHHNNNNNNNNVNIDGFDWMQVHTPFIYNGDTSNRSTISDASDDGDFGSHGH